MIAYVINKFKGWLALLGAAIVAMLYAYAKGRRGGVVAAHRESEKAAQKVQDKWSEIDNRTPDLDAALGKLRKRGDGQ